MTDENNEPGLRAQIETLQRQVTELQEALLKSEQKFCTLTDSAPVGIFLDDAEGRAIFVNKKCAELVGVPAESALNFDWSPYLHPDDRELMVTTWEAAYRTSTVFHLEYRWVHSDGKVVWTLGEVVPIFGDDGKVDLYIGTLTDVTERRQAEEKIHQLNAELEHRVQERTDQLTAANQELEAFSYSVSHDLRAPLRAVDGFSRLVEEDYAKRIDDEGRRMLGMIRSETRRMGRLIDDLLAFSRLGRQRPEPEPIDMRDLAQEVYDELMALEPPGRKLKLDLQALPAVEGTRTMIRQVWVNLIGNAIKFTKERETGEIEIAAQPDENGVPVFRIKDNGAGFDMRHANKLFGVFQRLHNASEFPGTGVGLALVQRIVQRHGGKVWGLGEVDHGATFFFTIPNPSS